MVTENTNGQISDEDRRTFLKALGVGGAVAAGSASLDDVRNAVTAGESAQLAQIGSDVRADLTGSLDAAALADGQAELASAVSSLTAAAEQGLPAAEQRAEFESLATASQPIYDHLETTGFFQSTDAHLPQFEPSYLESAVSTFVGSEALTEPLASLGLTDGDGVDLLTEVIANAEELDAYHWVASEEIPRSQIEFGEKIPPMTKAASFGVLAWLNDLDEHLWQKQVLLDDGHYGDAVWHARSMAAGLQLVSEGAKAVAEESGRFSDEELSALLTTGFAVQAIAQNMLPKDVYWVTEEMRAPRN
ncbi:twin-arginine translocation signal domain-containing protein [Halolamina salifodinae]|uniref:Twin-arginine translocation signal domain-containing protein n=1 Tax=Halolamina salifodinae TaxID=1202767 RepID=A0A8T4H0Q6_9EURY|nr:twin-arginine translocation signal domain-containing protein [Halolamina salifodinae]MBP1987165.1 hypothetical protein [Halolamina salifodinae]